jgi:molybdopterin synthase catalytic subunit
LIPPIAVRKGPLDAAAMRACATDPRAGAVVVFEGCARDHHGGRAVTELAYEAFEPMALAQLEEVRRGALGRFGLQACLIHHRLGTVPLMEAAIVVVTASAHRREAFEAALWIMDEVKRRVPIWKREAYVEGGEAWVEGEKREQGSGIRGQ